MSYGSEKHPREVITPSPPILQDGGTLCFCNLPVRLSLDEYFHNEMYHRFLKYWLTMISNVAPLHQQPSIHHTVMTSNYCEFSFGLLWLRFQFSHHHLSKTGPLPNSFHPTEWILTWSLFFMWFSLLFFFFYLSLTIGSVKGWLNIAAEIWFMCWFSFQTCSWYHLPDMSCWFTGKCG